MAAAAPFDTGSTRRAARREVCQVGTCWSAQLGRSAAPQGNSLVQPIEGANVIITVDNYHHAVCCDSELMRGSDVFLCRCHFARLEPYDHVDTETACVIEEPMG